jgi:hypothetical protein
MLTAETMTKLRWCSLHNRRSEVQNVHLIFCNLLGREMATLFTFQSRTKFNYTTMNLLGILQVFACEVHTKGKCEK